MAFPKIALIAHGAFDGGTSLDIPIAEGGAFYADITESWCGFTAAVEGDGGNPVVEGFAQTTPTTAGTSHAVNLPASIASGEYLIAAVAVDGTPTISWPGGWSEIASGNDGSNASKVAIAYRVADGSEGSTITVGTGASESLVAHVYRISNAAGTPEAGSAATEPSGNLGGQCRCGSLRPSWTGPTLFLAIGGWDATPSMASLVGPLLYTNVSSTGGSSAAATIASARRLADVPAITDIFELVLTASDGNPTLTWPSGWDSRYATANGLACRLEARSRALQSGDGATIAITQSSTEALTYISLAITGSANEIEVAAANTGNSNAPDPPSLNPSGWGTEDTLWLSVAVADGETQATAFPANHTGYQWENVNNAGGVLLAFTTRENAAANEDPGSYTISIAEQWVAGTIAIRPAQPASTYEESIALASGEVMSSVGGLAPVEAVALGAVGDLSASPVWTLAGGIPLGAGVQLASAHDLAREGTVGLATGLAGSASPAGSIFNVTLTAAIETDAAMAGLIRFDRAVAFEAATGVPLAGGLSLEDALALGAAPLLAASGGVVALSAVALGSEIGTAPAAVFVASPAASLAAGTALSPAARLDAADTANLATATGLIALGLLDAKGAASLSFGIGLGGNGALESIEAAALGLATDFAGSGALSAEPAAGFGALLTAAALGQLPSEIPPEPGKIVHLDTLVGRLEVTLQELSGLCGGDAQAAQVESGNAAGGDWSAADSAATGLGTDDEA